MSGHLPWQKNPELTSGSLSSDLVFCPGSGLRSALILRQLSSVVLGNLINTVYSDPAIRSFFLSCRRFSSSCLSSGHIPGGDFLGFSQSILAYLAGLFILVSTVTALVFLGVAIIIGYLAPDRRLIKKMTGT